MSETSKREGPRRQVPRKDLQDVREGIEGIDHELLALLKRRMALVESIAHLKVEAAYPFRDEQREERVLQGVRQAAVELGLDAHAVERLYRLIMQMSLSHQQSFIHSLGTAPLRVAYQGVEGSYSHLTAQRRYGGRPGGVLLSGFESVHEAVAAVRSGAADAALLPIENSTAGSINETYDELAAGGVSITAEAVTRVEHCLVGLPGAEVGELRRVISHPQALRQCEDFLRSLSAARLEAEYDTAGAARKVKESGDPTLAAVASESAAEMLGLEVLAKGIQTAAGNATRFVEVAREAASCSSQSACKTSLLLTLPHSAGVLGEVLVQFGRRGIQLTKLESRPIASDRWRYCFYLDVEGHAGEAKMEEALDKVRELVTELRLLGTYPKAE